MDINAIIFFGCFLVFIISILFIDLKVVGRESHVISFKEALTWTSIWVALALLFYVFLLFKGDLIHGLANFDSIEDIKLFISEYHSHLDLSEINSKEKILLVYRHNLALEYLTGYIIEYSLSVDNVFVMIMIFMAFGVEQKYYKRVLFWGILGAIVMRFLFIFLSAALIHKFDWVLYIFGAFLVFTGVKLFINRNEEERFDTKNHPVVKFVSRYFSVYPEPVGDRFWIKIDEKTFITPLMIVLVVIELMDVVFAIDSIPAIFSVTTDPFIVFFSNIFAILGLRSLFFLVMNVMSKFRFLKHGLAILLTFIGVKMLAHTWLDGIGFKTSYSLYIVVGIIGLSIIFSILYPEEKKSENDTMNT